MRRHHVLQAGRWAALLLGGLLALPAAAQQSGMTTADPYGETLALARAATSREDMEAASRALSVLLPRYPQDVDIPLQLGWLMFRLTRYTDSLYIYQIALSRSTPGSDAELGIAWSLLRLGRCAEARGHFQTVLAVTGGQGTAAEGLRKCSPQTGSAPAPGSPSGPVPSSAPAPGSAPAPASTVWVQPALAQSLFVYQNHPIVSYAVAPMARVEALWRGRYYGSVAYRYSYFATRDGVTPAWSQHDLYVNAGITAKAAGLTLQYALIADGSGYSGTTHHVGLTGRYSRVVDTLLNLSASIYADAPVLRGELAFVLPIVGGLSARPAGAVQWTPTETFKTVSLTASYYHPRFSLWLGGKVGDEKRAAYLSIAYVYNSPARIPYGVWAGATIRPGGKFSLNLGYAYDRLLRSDTTPVQDSVVHSLTLGLAREF